MERLIRKGIFIVILFFGILSSCNKSNEIPPEILENIFYESLLTEHTVRQIETLSTRKKELSYYEPILKKYGYTVEDLGYTVEKLIQRKSEIINIITTNVVARFKKESENISRRYDITTNWTSYINEYISDTLYTNEKGIKITSLKQVDSTILKMPLKGVGKYSIMMTYSVEKGDKNLVRYLNGELSDSLLDGISYQKFSKVIDTYKGMQVEHSFEVTDPRLGNMLVLNLVARNSFQNTEKNTEKNKRKFTKPKISITEIFLTKKPIIDDGDLRLYEMFLGLKFPTRIVNKESFVYIRPPYRIKENIKEDIKEDIKENIK